MLSPAHAVTDTQQPSRESGTVKLDSVAPSMTCQLLSRQAGATRLFSRPAPGVFNARVKRSVVPIVALIGLGLQRASNFFRRRRIQDAHSVKRRHALRQDFSWFSFTGAAARNAVLRCSNDLEIAPDEVFCNNERRPLGHFFEGAVRRIAYLPGEDNIRSSIKSIRILEAVSAGFECISLIAIGNAFQFVAKPAPIP